MIKFTTPEPLPEGYTVYPTLAPVEVPANCYPIKVVQYWRGEVRRGNPYPLHWAIHVHTSSNACNTHEIVGDMHTYATQDRFDVPLFMRNDWRGSQVVGYVAPNRMDDLLNLIALTPVVHHHFAWNCQNWVYDVLEKLKVPGELYADEKLSFGRLQTQMRYLLEAWEVGDI